jgi:hypothetical protein
MKEKFNTGLADRNRIDPIKRQEIEEKKNYNISPHRVHNFLFAKRVNQKK